MIKLLCQTKRLRLTNARLTEYPLYLSHVRELAVERIRFERPVEMPSQKRLKSFQIHLSHKQEFQRWFDIIRQVERLEITAKSKYYDLGQLLA